MGRWSEPLAAVFCVVIFALWRWGYPLTPWAAIMPLVAFMVVGRGIYLRRVQLTLALREGVFLPHSRYKRWFRGRISGICLAVIEGTAIVLAMCHFSLHAGGAELALAGGIGTCTLITIAGLRHRLADELRAEFAASVSAWAAAAVALPFCILHFWMQKNVLPPPAYLEATGFMNVLQAALAELPDRRDGLIEALGTMQLVQAAIHWMLSSLGGFWGVWALLFIYNAAVLLAIGRFFADVAAAFIIARP